MKIKHSMIILLTKRNIISQKIEAMVDNKAQYSF